MTVFPVRATSKPKKPETTMPGSASRVTLGDRPRTPVSRSPLATPAPIVEENMFEHIIFPDEDDEMSFGIASDTNEHGSTSEHGSSARRKSWDTKPSSEHCTTPSATSTSAASVSGFSGKSCSVELHEEPPKSKSGSGSTGSGGCRFSKDARSVLRTWYHEHRENPYPSSSEKDALVLATGLKRSQISLWLANTRRKDRARANEKAKAATAMPHQKTFAEMNPFDRWKVTPIELEAVAPPVILAACEDNPLQPLDSILEDTQTNIFYEGSLFDAEQSTANFSQYDAYFAQSMASYDTNLTSLLGGESVSDHTQFSYNSLPSGMAPLPRPNDRRRRRVNPSKPSKAAAKNSSKARPFHCTFCTSTFSTKHDWARHEKSQHLSLETWICCASGGTIGDQCAFCDHANPDQKHLEMHNFSACQVKEAAERTFYRKDHFMQHLRLTHETKINSRMEQWKSEFTEVRSRCGFCNATLNTWAQRAEHLASHFKCQATMKEWRGDWGFEDHVMALVERAPRAVDMLQDQLDYRLQQSTISQTMQMPLIRTDSPLVPPVPLFTQKEVDDAVAALSYQNHMASQGLPLQGYGSGRFVDIGGARMGMNMPLGGMVGVDGLVHLPTDFIDPNISSLRPMESIGIDGLPSATDTVDWAQFTG